MAVELKDVLNLVGKIDDSPGEDTPRERFRRFLKDQVTEVGSLRDYVQECLRNTGDQYNKALQDLVNRTGELLGFEVTYGRYRGVPGEIGFDGLWRSPEDFFAVVEVKTTETYSVSTKGLVGYVNELISGRLVPSWDKAIGLYVVGRPDPETRQIENAVVAEKRTNELRVVSVDALLSLTELMHDYDVEHLEILRFIKPPGPNLTGLVGLVSSIAAQALDMAKGGPKAGKMEVDVSRVSEVDYWMTPVQGDETRSPEDVIRELLSGGVYAFGERTPGRTQIKPGDWICFYASGSGVVARARVTTPPVRKPHRLVRDPEKYAWTFTLEKVEMWLEKPIPIEESLRSRLDAFQGKETAGSWGWFVQATRMLSNHDFVLLTGKDLSQGA